MRKFLGCSIVHPWLMYQICLNCLQFASVHFVPQMVFELQTPLDFSIAAYSVLLSTSGNDQLHLPMALFLPMAYPFRNRLMFSICVPRSLSSLLHLQSSTTLV